MRFLCQAHLEEYTAKSDDSLSQTWVEWMYNAGVCYELAEWKRALSYAGSAFDLARMRAKRRRPATPEVITQITLSGIYLANVFDHLVHPDEASHVRLLANECLGSVHPRLDIVGKAECNTCKRYINDVERQGSFVKHYLNIPFEKPVGSSGARATLH